MADMLARGMTFLHDQRHAHMSRTVTYSRPGGASIELQATVGETTFEQQDRSGMLHEEQSRDFLVLAADLRSVGLDLPKAGDEIREPADEATYVFEVSGPDGGTPWRYSDPTRITLRIHTKFMKRE